MLKPTWLKSAINITSTRVEFSKDSDSGNRSEANITALVSTILKPDYSQESVQIVEFLILSKRLEGLDKK